MPRDIRELKDIPDHWRTGYESWRNASFVWKEWNHPSENWTHDHCWFCFACICDHRARFPEWMQSHEERGCYRHAYYTEEKPGVYLWVCRNCFKRLKAEFGWNTADEDADPRMKRDIDFITEQLTGSIPGIRIEQLKVAHPGADDDGLWFINIPDQEKQVQIESSEGSCPFLIESDFNDERLHGRTVQEVVATVKRLFSLA